MPIALPSHYKCGCSVEVLDGTDPQEIHATCPQHGHTPDWDTVWSKVEIRSAPRMVEESDLVEFTNGVRLKDRHIKRMSRTKSYRWIAEYLGISYMELIEGVALLRGKDPNEALMNDPTINTGS